MIAILLFVLGVLGVAGAVTLLICALVARDGHEDAAGFHAHKSRAAVRKRRPIAKPTRESQSLNV